LYISYIILPVPRIASTLPAPAPKIRPPTAIPAPTIATDKYNKPRQSLLIVF